jgi:hypothetical protein
MTRWNTTFEGNTGLELGRMLAYAGVRDMEVVDGAFSFFVACI